MWTFFDSLCLNSKGKDTTALKVNKNLFTPDVIIFPTMFKCDKFVSLFIVCALSVKICTLLTTGKSLTNDSLTNARSRNTIVARRYAYNLYSYSEMIRNKMPKCIQTSNRCTVKLWTNIPEKFHDCFLKYKCVERNKQC